MKRARARERISAVSGAAADAFKKALRLRDHREEQVANHEACPGIGDCATCGDYEKLVATVGHELGLKPWDINPVDVGDVPPPPFWRARQQAAWDHARGLHVRLCEMAKVEPVRKVRPTDADRGHMNIRWIERHAFVPDGPNVGQPFRLLEFQRGIIRGIYSDPGYWRDVDAVLKKGRAA